MYWGQGACHLHRAEKPLIQRPDVPFLTFPQALPGSGHAPSVLLDEGTSWPETKCPDKFQTQVTLGTNYLLSLFFGLFE